MCGLFGAMSSSLTTREIENVNTLGVLSAFRGNASVGLCVVTRDKKKMKARIKTSLDDVFDVLREKETLRFMAGNGKVPCAIIGHTRAPTAGDLHLANAQPIKANAWIVTHNGRIPSLCEPRLTQTTPVKLSDSVLAVDEISRFGLSRTIQSRFNETGAATAMTAFNTNDRKIRFFRNEQRPLWFLFNPEGNTLYWASEKEALEFAVNRGVEPHKRKTPIRMPAFMMLTLAVGSTISESDIKYESIASGASALLPETKPTTQAVTFPAAKPVSITTPTTTLKDRVLALGLERLTEDLKRDLEKGGGIPLPSNFLPAAASSLPPGPSLPISAKPAGLIDHLDNIAATKPELISALVKPGFDDPYSLYEGVVSGYVGPMGVTIPIAEAEEFFAANTCSCCWHKPDPHKEEVVWWPGWDHYLSNDINSVADLEFLCEKCAQEKDMFDHIYVDSPLLHTEGAFTVGRPIVEARYPTSH